VQELGASSQLPTTSYAVLGLVSLKPTSGYELAVFADKSVAQMWPIAKSQVYGELARLEELGYVRGTDVAQAKLPDKRVYALTDSGVAALDTWLSEPSYGYDRWRNSFLVKVFFANRMEPGRLEALIRRYRTEAKLRRDRLVAIADRLQARGGSVYRRSTALFGVRHEEATIAWADEMLAEIPAMQQQYEAATRARPEPEVAAPCNPSDKG